MSQTSDTQPFERWESNVRSYSRAFPAVFSRAKNAEVWDEQGRKWIDFFSGAGTLNYGHNPPSIQKKLVEYISSDGIVHALDSYTVAKREFLARFGKDVLEPRGLDFKVQCCGPTGANSVEAALKLVRRVTGRDGVIAFSGAYHGMSLGAASITGAKSTRRARGVSVGHTTFVPYPVGPMGEFDSLGLLRHQLEDLSSGVELPAAVFIESVQMDGGVYVAPEGFLRELRALCDKHQVLLVVDDIQAGCGRSGKFFSFERAGITPDVVTVSKSIGGMGLPMALLLMKKAHDVWKPGEHTGTFRGHQLSFVAATAALDLWTSAPFQSHLAALSALLQGELAARFKALNSRLEVRGIGGVLGVDVRNAGGEAAAAAVGRACFEQGLMIERCGREDTVLKVLPPLSIPLDQLRAGCAILEGELKRVT
ncbi:MAG: diaminobutyrate--2-oxoglutarate transaminase [Myxococcaceae bacterium]|nr:diaminobutyrate--2-oxoglutarate transaminase [Myxococcaceae bacterium]